MTKKKEPIDKIKLDGLNLRIFESGIKKKNTDLLLITFPKFSSVSGVFTKSKTPSYAVMDCRHKIKLKKKKY